MPSPDQVRLSKPNILQKMQSAVRDCALPATKPKHDLFHRCCTAGCRKDDPPPCNAGFHRARRRTPCRYVTTVPLAILLSNVPLLSQAPGFIPSKPIRAQRGLRREGGKTSVSREKKKKRGAGCKTGHCVIG